MPGGGYRAWRSDTYYTKAIASGQAQCWGHLELAAEKNKDVVFGGGIPNTTSLRSTLARIRRRVACPIGPYVPFRHSFHDSVRVASRPATTLVAPRLVTFETVLGEVMAKSAARELQHDPPQGLHLLESFAFLAGNLGLPPRLAHHAGQRTPPNINAIHLHIHRQQFIICKHVFPKWGVWVRPNSFAIELEWEQDRQSCMLGR